jgi:hypothetical protein
MAKAAVLCESAAIRLKMLGDVVVVREKRLLWLSLGFTDKTS